MTKEDSKADIIRDFYQHVSSGKATFYKKYGMDFVMGRREGNWLWDINGKKKLFNLHCNGGVFNLGHKNQEIIDAVKAGMDEVDIGNHHLMSRYRAATAKKLADLMPGNLNYTVFGVSGGEAVDLALKVARGYSKKTKIISAKGGYHGHTGLALAAGDEKYWKPFGPPAPGFVQVPFGNADVLNREMDDNTAAVILETIPATLGVMIPGKKYLQDVREICDHWGAQLILDEVQTGLGRTGKLWAFEHYDIIPDMVVLGKGLSGGIYPITATVIRDELESVFHEDPFIHISTFGGSELGCIAAQKVLEISSNPDFLAHVNDLSDRLGKKLEMLTTIHRPFFTGYRQLGLMIGLTLRDSISGPVLTKAAYDHDLLLVYANNDTSVCQFLPPLTMEISAIDEVMEALDKALTSGKRLRRLVKAKSAISSLRKGFKS